MYSKAILKILLIILFLCFGCRGKSEDVKKNTFLLDLKDTENYIGSAIISIVDYEKSYFEKKSSKIFWKKKGVFNQVELAFPAHYGFYSKNNQKIVFVSFSDVIEIDSVTGEISPVIPSEKGVFYGACARNSIGSDLLVSGCDHGKYFCLSIDLETKVSMPLYFPERIRGIVFVDETTAFVYTSKKMFELNITDNTLHQTSDLQIEGSSFLGFLGKVPAFYREQGTVSFLEWANISIEFDSIVPYVFLKDDLIWIITLDNNVYQINENGNKEFVDTLGAKYNSAGVVDEGIYVLSENNDLVIYKKNKTKSHVRIDVSNFNL